MKLICVFSVFFLFTSIWILLSHHSEILSHFMYFNFLAFFFFFLDYTTSEKQLFPHRHQSITSLLCCILPSPPVVSLLTLLPLLFFLTLPVLDSSPPSLLSLMLLSVLSLHPSCQAERGASLRRRLWTGASLSGGLCQVGTPPREPFASLTARLAGVIPPLHSELDAQRLCQKLG